jgi:hypothetical protein
VRPTKRTKEYTGEYAETNITTTPHGDTPNGSHGNAASYTANAGEKLRQTSPTTPPRQAIHNDLISRDTTTYGVLVGTATIALRTVSGTSNIHHDEESITFYDSSANLQPGAASIQPTGTAKKRKTNRTPHGRGANAQAGAWHPQ